MYSHFLKILTSGLVVPGRPQPRRHSAPHRRPDRRVGSSARSSTTSLRGALQARPDLSKNPEKQYQISCRTESYEIRFRENREQMILYRHIRWRVTKYDSEEYCLIPSDQMRIESFAFNEFFLWADQSRFMNFVFGPPPFT